MIKILFTSILLALALLVSLPTYAFLGSSQQIACIYYAPRVISGSANIGVSPTGGSIVNGSINGSVEFIQYKGTQTICPGYWGFCTETPCRIMAEFERA